MTRSSALALALAVTGCSVSGFVAPISRPTVPVCAKSEGRICNALPQHHTHSGRGNAVRPLGSSILSLDNLTSILGGGTDDIPTLPQEEEEVADIRERNEQLLQAQALYRWNSENIPVGVPYLDDFPPTEQDPSVVWVLKVVEVFARILVGTLRSGQIGLATIALTLTSPEEAISLANAVYLIINNYIGNVRPDSIEDYNKLHAAPMKTPDAEYDYDDDDTFARMRLQGPNCVVIQKCTQATHDKLKILGTDPEYSDLKAQVDALMTDGKLFVVDQELIKDHVADNLDWDAKRYLSCGVALFEATDDEFLPLKPIGIQLTQGTEATPIFTPSDGYNWMIAKTCFEAAEFIIHEVVSHLGNTHLVLEGALVGVYRNFAKEHPIHVLMTPHLEGTALINWGAQDILIVEGGGVDLLVANRIEDCWQLASEQRISGDFSPEADIESRGMTTEDFPGRYMYRDYGLQFWDATHTWVKEYLSIYYKSDADVEADTELMAFVDEMVTTGKVGWLEEVSSSKDKIGVIAKVLASYIYSASTLHAAVNFPQQSIMAYNPATPGSVYQPPPTDKEERTFEDYLAYLPPMQIATLQVVVGTLLGSVYHTKLGDYKANQFTDERVREPLSKFQNTIEEIEIDLEFENSNLVNTAMERGKDKKEAKNFAYKTLLPDNIPQSINI